ncbi:ADP-L-glycero-D-manno-heptose-6-epimerase [uncultured archaeon]|nr:ADP-L-glycero-D-manno-heptose-6-epimerase [uncultured archaeon]
MKLLVTGGSGLMGSKVAELGLQKGYEVFSGYAHHLPMHGATVKIDLRTDSSVVEAVKAVRPDVIVHTAALTDVDLCETDKNLAYRMNAQATKTLAESAREVGAFTVYTSTDYVFDGSRGMYKEEDATNPVNYYGYSKLQGELYCDAVARTCVIYGSRPASGKVNFALWILERLRKEEAVKVVTDQYITPTLNTNLALMVLELAERKLDGLYHLAGATRISRYDFAVELARNFGLDEGLIIKSRMSEMKWAAIRPVDSSLDTSKASRCLDAKPWSIEEALRTLKNESG